MRSRLAYFFQPFSPIFRPPFDGLWLVVLLYYVWCFLVYPHSQVLRGNFPDPDDYMYLVQVMDWVKGQGWYDNIQHRLNPPEGVMIHFSRLAMIPMAGMVLLFKLFGWGIRGSSMLMAGIYPLILLGGFLVTLRRVAESLMPKDWAGITAYVALFSTAMMYMFQPGHVDHHGLIIWIVAGALACALRMMQEPDRFRWGVAAGIILAFGLVIALEILPWLLIIGGWLGLWAVVKGRVAARHGFVFALSLHLASIVGLLLTRPPEDFFIFDVLTYSCVYVFLTGGIAICFAAVAVAAEMKLPLRLTAGTVFSLLCGFLFLHRFPDLIAGPYGAMDPELQELILGVVTEATPLTGRFPDTFILLIWLSATFLALASGFYFFWTDRPKRWLWGLLLVLLITAFLLTTFYQCRYGATMGMLTVFPLATLLQRSWRWVSTNLKGRARFIAEIGLLLLVGPLPCVFLPALVDGRSFNRGVMLFPVSGGNENICDTFVLEQVLRDSIHLGDHPRLIMADMGLGPELLFRTSHNVLAAPFLDTTGNMDSYRFFSTPYPGEAKAIAMRRHVDVVLACVAIPAAYMRKNLTQPDSKITKDFAPHFVEMLIAGKTPDWLHRITVKGMNNFAVYEVVPPKGKTEPSPATP